MSASEIISALWGATDTRALTNEQLETLASGEDLNQQLKDVAEIMMATGSLISSDGEVALRAGNFQESDSVSQLLWHLADVIKTHAAATDVVSRARDILNQRGQ